MKSKTENRGGVRTSLTKKIGRPKGDVEMENLLVRVPKGRKEEFRGQIKELIKKLTQWYKEVN